MGLSSLAPTPRTVPRRRRVPAHRFTRKPMRGQNLNLRARATRPRARPTIRGRALSQTGRNEGKFETVRETRAEPEEIEEDIGMQTPAAQRFPARERRAPGEWYRANLAAEPQAGEHPKGTGEHAEPQTYQEAVGGEESELWRKSRDEEMRSLLENGTWELVENRKGSSRVLWVDDILVAARGAERIAKVKARSGKKFDVRDRGEAKNFLGMELTRDREACTLKLTQKKLTGELVGRQLARLRALWRGRPTEEHWRAALGVVRYLAITAEDGVTFGGSGETLIAYCDADNASDVDTKRSTTGHVLLMYGAARSKHINVIHHFARERVARKEVAFAYCGTEDMKEDIMTKALAARKLKKCKSEIGIAYVISVWGSVEIRAFDVRDLLGDVDGNSTITST
ncbi:hypothetical protein KFL_013270020 [Klebsormidium nitens]|uniref:Reverse transcriptase Ty1/copia-type domain-containing protein n=1 Tax=Klebsormidium nitens TaxID=105231 RepID=A0A1Y1IQG6_KLENI|nr:hypothetical protein KFL_013270020 [Klebsormidium nitens]|eukprot:GAQ93155.1 hypothetical protein KFL_013270020 [Klebsormidium nitens]